MHSYVSGDAFFDFNFAPGNAVFRQPLVAGTDFSRAGLASALGHLGELDQARRVWRELKEINPKYSFREHLSRQPFRQEDVERVAEGLTKVGLPN